MLWVKAFHVIFMVTWFAGLFYLPRLFVYHAATEDAAGRERFKIMERKLYYGITTPGGLATIVFGLWLLFDYGWAAWAHSGWLHLKLALVGILILYHLHCGKLVRDFARDRNRHSHVFYRWYNEFPVFILMGCVILVIIKPF
ncbi:MAG TPA: protoporphyrinogen oxidase HemJ [Gammaproteobacteria bacterium]|nr:protoporphyrinogen oxidase HemJ [Gammaproteobacteria bacterium]